MKQSRVLPKSAKGTRKLRKRTSLCRGGLPHPWKLFSPRRFQQWTQKGEHRAPSTEQPSTMERLDEYNRQICLDVAQKQLNMASQRKKPWPQKADERDVSQAPIFLNNTICKLPFMSKPLFKPLFLSQARSGFPWDPWSLARRSARTQRPAASPRAGATPAALDGCPSPGQLGGKVAEGRGEEEWPGGESNV